MWPTATWLFTHTHTVKQRFRLVLCIFEISSKYWIYCCNHSTTEQNRNLIRTSAIEEFEFPNPNILESFNQLRIGSKDCPRSKQLLEMEEKSNLTMIWNSEQYVMITFLTILSKLYTSKTPWPKAASSQFYIVYLCAFYGSTQECYKHTIYMYV